MPALRDVREVSAAATRPVPNSQAAPADDRSTRRARHCKRADRSGPQQSKRPGAAQRLKRNPTRYHQRHNRLVTSALRESAGDQCHAKGDIMKRSLSLLTLLAVTSLTVTGCVLPHSYNLPPAERLFGPGPGVGGPGPGVQPPRLPSLPHQVMPAPQPSVQILFSDAHQMEGMQVRWDVGGVGMFDSEPLVFPGRYNFPQGGIYRLKLTNIPGRVGVELYPTLEIAPTTPRTAAYLAHNAIPIEFTNEDFDQVESNNYVTKVIYLPDPEFQELAQAGIETLVSTRLDPGIDPIKEADRRGSIMSILRMGNKDVEMPGANNDGVQEIIQASYGAGGGYTGTGPMGAPVSMSGPTVGFGGLMPQYVAGVTTSPWGMPMSGTPIGIPGPPHIPLSHPAGLMRHTMYNHTPMYIPGPNRSMVIHARQNPGYSYPRAPSRVRIVEQNIHAPQRYWRPKHTTNQQVH